MQSTSPGSVTSGARVMAEPKGIHVLSRRGRDSNPRGRYSPAKRISSAPRYGLFDTSPIVVLKALPDFSELS